MIVQNTVQNNSYILNRYKSHIRWRIGEGEEEGVELGEGGVPSTFMQGATLKKLAIVAKGIKEAPVTGNPSKRQGCLISMTHGNSSCCCDSPPHF